MMKHATNKKIQYSNCELRRRRTMLAVAAAFLMLSSFAASRASAQVRISSMTVPSSLPDPLSPFTVNYWLTGSNYGVGAASAELRFYISASPDGSTGVALLSSRQILLHGSGFGPYYPPSGSQSAYMYRLNMPANTVALLESIAAACQPQTWYILGHVVGTTMKSGQSVMGTTKQPDFFFTGGTISPAEIQPGGSTSISFDLYTRCAASASSRVGIFLADASYQPLALIGAVSIAAGAGTSTLPPTPITFSPFIPTGTYHIVLIADLDEVIYESDEDNNVGDFTLYITMDALAAADNVDELDVDVKLSDDVHSELHELELKPSDAYIEHF